MPVRGNPGQHNVIRNAECSLRRARDLEKRDRMVQNGEYNENTETIKYAVPQSVWRLIYTHVELERGGSALSVLCWIYHNIVMGQLWKM